MMPMNPAGPGGPPPGAGGPMPPGGGGPGEGGGNPDQIKSQLVMLLKKAKEVAEQNGVNFSEVLSAVEGKQVKSDVPLPRPPSPGGPGY
jgi:hypothetical protein